MLVSLLRHGETSWNNAHRFQGRIDIPLNDFGRELARITRDAAPTVAYDRVYSSPLGRAVETAHIFTEGRFPSDAIRLDDRLLEISFGEHEGTDIELASKDPSHPLYQCLWSPESYVPTCGAESFEHLVARAGDFLTHELVPLAASCSHVLVVAHGALIRGIVSAAGFKPIKDFWGVQYLNCCITTLEISNDGQVSMLKEAEVFYDPASLKHHGWSK